MSPIDITSVLNTAIANLPGVIALIKGDHAAKNPGAPLLTDEEVKKALLMAIDPSLLKDAAWLEANKPVPPTDPATDVTEQD